VVAAAHFRHLAARRGLQVDAVAAGTEPDPELAPAAREGLAADGLAATPSRPRPVTLYDLETSSRIVSFGCELAPRRAVVVERWDVPAISEGYEGARDRILERVERLVAELAGRSHP
jgi:protein-tyrosine-phosphatase